MRLINSTSAGDRKEEVSLSPERVPVVGRPECKGVVPNKAKIVCDH